MVTLPHLEQVWFHRDYDGLIAAAMVQACVPHTLTVRGLDFVDNRAWPKSVLPPGTAVLDFPFHPSAALWIDHHDTAFMESTSASDLPRDPWHVLDTAAASCPEVIAAQPWFRPQVPLSHLERWVYWSCVIDSARYASPTEANDLNNPHILLALVVPACHEDADLAELVEAAARGSVEDVLATRAGIRVGREVCALDQELRPVLARASAMRGRIAFLDQSFTALPYRRYLPYEVHPEAHYVVGIYRHNAGFVVSVGENPWRRTGRVHLGDLCRRWGGGGRVSTAGVPATTLELARQIAEQLITALRQRTASRTVSPQQVRQIRQGRRLATS